VSIRPKQISALREKTFHRLKKCVFWTNDARAFFPSLLVQRSLRLRHIVEELEHAVEPRYAKAFTNLTRGSRHVQFAACLVNPVEARDAAPDPGAVDVGNTGHVEDEFSLPLLNQIGDKRLEPLALGAEHEPSRHGDELNAGLDLPVFCLQLHQD
jgi:hypothetical protein